MTNLILIFALSNLLGGRWEDVWGAKTGGRLICRCFIPALAVLPYSPWAALAVFLGSMVWATPAWSFDEINGQFERGKYDASIERIGLWAFPLDVNRSTNRKRGVLMKGLRGLYDAPTFAMLALLNPFALALLPFCALMGVVYWLAGRLIAERQAVALAELLYGAARGLLIFTAVIWAA